MNNTPKKKVAPEPVSAFPYNQGIFTTKTTDATLVTTLYDIPSSITTFKQRFDSLEFFLQTVPKYTIVFTQSNLVDKILGIANDPSGLRLRVVVLEKNQWVANTKYKPNLWTDQVKQDPEIRLSRTAEEFQYGYEKKEFMVKAAEMNPFESTDFVWVDPLLFQTKEPLSSLFPLATRIPTDRILVSNPEPFTADDIASSFFKGKRRIDNLILAGSKRSWDEYAKLYDVVIAQKLKYFSFIGDDFLMIHYVILHKPNQFCLVKEPLRIYLSTPQA
jgi:hypothetical protein